MSNPNPTLIVRDFDTNEPTIFDPCFCGNPLNILDNSTGLVTRFHDFVEITDDAGGEVWRLTSVNAGDFLDEDGNPIALNTPLVFSAATGVYRIDLFHLPSIGFNASFTRDSDGFTLSVGGTCEPCPSNIIPTMSEWGLLIFLLLVMNLSLVFLRRLEVVRLN